MNALAPLDKSQLPNLKIDNLKSYEYTLRMRYLKYMKK